MGLASELKAYARRLGIDRLGIAAAEPFEAERLQLEAAKAEGKYPPFSENNIQLRTHPRAILPSARSIISVAVNYLTDDPPHPPSSDGRPRAWVSRYAWGEHDYHRLLAEKLDALIAFLQERTPHPVEARPYVDTGPPIDRSVAQRAGVGYFGKNCCIYVPGHGSWVFLAEIITNVELQPDPPLYRDCGDCDRCIRACPTGAIIGPYRIDPYRCLSYITQMPGFIPRQFRRPMGRMLFGCDICQAVCPWNREALPANRPEFRPHPELGSRPDLIPLLSLTNKEFRRLFSQTAMGWRGKKTIQRNACICLGNIGDPAAVPALAERLLTDGKPEVRGSAAWALGEIGGDEAVAALRQAAQKEKDPRVIDEIQEALEQALRPKRPPRRSAELNGATV